jgi:hypothetical protein
VSPFRAFGGRAQLSLSADRLNQSRNSVNRLAFSLHKRTNDSADRVYKYGQVAHEANLSKAKVQRAFAKAKAFRFCRL